MKEAFFDFLFFKYPNVKYVVGGIMLLMICSSMVGCFTFLKKKALLGDVISHALLPGICLSFILVEVKNPFWLVIGAFISGWLSILTMDFILRHSKIKEDTATGMVLSVFFGIGILLLTFIQHSGNASQTGLDVFLFGKAATLVGEDLIVYGGLAFLILFIIFIFFKEFKLLTFDILFAKSTGMNVKLFETLLTSLTVLAVIVGVKAVGVVLMAAMLITPATTARFWTNSLVQMLWLSAFFGCVAGYFGTFISFAIPQMPTGPSIVLILSFIALFSFFFATRKGILVKYIRLRMFRVKLLDENILKTFYAVWEKSKIKEYTDLDTLLEKRHFINSHLNKGLNRLTKHGFLLKKDNKWKLTQSGFNKGKRIQRLHRLWELYLTKHLQIASDHVHEDAESIEHIITPEIEKELEIVLGNPSKDPHQSEIPNK